MIDNSIINNICLAFALWVMLTFSDYYLTIFTDRKLREKLNDQIILDNSVEITPFLQSELDKEKLFSLKHIITVTISAFFLYISWRWSNYINSIRYYHFVFGWLILPFGAVHLRHLQKVALYSSYKDGAIVGKRGYSKWYSLRLSSWDIFGFGLLFFGLSFIENSWTLAGGAVGCFIDAFYHFILANKELEGIDT